MIKSKVILIGLVFLSNYLFSQKTFTYNGNTINLDEIPLGRSLDKPVKGSKSIVEGKNLTYEKIFASDNKKFIAISETFNTTDSKNSNGVVEGTFKIFSSNGSLIWETKQENYSVSECLIDPDGDYFHVNWHASGEEVYSTYITYDKKGKQINKIDNSSYIFTGNKKDKIFYLKNYGLTNSPDDRFKLYFKDFASGEQWEKVFPSTSLPLVVLSVSNSGEYIAVIDDNLYFLDNKGNILWQKERYESPGYLSITSGGDRILWNPEHGVFFLFDKSGKVLWEKGKIQFDNISFQVYRACFVKNNNRIIVVSDIISHTNWLVFLDIDGNILDKFSFDKKIHGNITVEQEENQFLIYNNGFKIFEYQSNGKNYNY